MTRVALVGAVIVGVVGLGDQQSVRAELRGTVIDVEAGKPLAGVLVTLMVETAQDGPIAISGRDGRFVFSAVPPGRYLLRPEKTGYVRPSWHPGQPSRIIVVEPGPRQIETELGLRRGSAISGTIRDGRGGLAGARVVLLRCQSVGPCEVRHSRQFQSTRSDSAGRYRFHGLPAGTYTVAVDPLGAGAGSRPILSTSVEDVRRAEAQFASGRAGGPPPAGTVPRPVASVISYYPGTTNPDFAKLVEVHEGVEHFQIDVRAEFGLAARVTGVVLTTDGRPAKSPVLSIFPADGPVSTVTSTMVRVDEVGRFETGALVPGRYRIAGRPSTDDWISDVIDVNGQDIENLILRSRPALSMTGRVAIDQSAGGSDLTSIRVNLQRLDSGVIVSTLDMFTATPDASGTFLLTRLIPGRYAVSLSAPTSNGRKWWIKSAVVAGQDVLDAGLEIGADASPAPLTIVLTARPARIAGVVLREGLAATEFLVVAFPVDPLLRQSHSRRMVTATVAADGSYVLEGLPPGEYYVGLLGSNDPADLVHSLFEAMSVGSHRVALDDGEIRLLDLKVK